MLIFSHFLGTDIATFTEKTRTVNDKVSIKFLLLKIVPDRMSRKNFSAYSISRLIQPMSQKIPLESHLKFCSTPQKIFLAFGSDKQVQPLSLKTL